MKQTITQYKKIQNKLLKGFYGFWIRNRRVSFLLTGLIVIMGTIAMISIPKESSPEIDLGIISITTIYKGATPQDVDNLITDKIEKEIKDIDGIKKITSTSRVGVSSIIIEFKNDTDMIQANMDITDAVDGTILPEDAEEPIIQDISTNNEMMFTVILYGDENKYSPFYLKEKGRILKANLEGKPGINRIDFDASSTISKSVGNVSSNGDDYYIIDVLVDKQKAENLGISLAQISQTIQNRNSNQPLGTHTIGHLNYDFRIQGELTNLQDLREVPIQTKAGSIYLKDIATIQKELKNDTIQIAGTYQTSGQNYISLVFNKQAGDNIFKASSSAKKELEKEFEKAEYNGLHYILTLDLSQTIKDDYNKLSVNGLQTLLFVFLALLLFVGFKESLIATITLPLAFFITFIVLQNLGLSLNFLTNFSFLITFGIAIDTTIVIIEGAHEKMKQGFKPKNAVLLAVKEYKTALISGTATTIVVFLPLLTLPGTMGKFLSYIPITIFTTLVAALLISLTLNSALYYKLSKPRKYFDSHIADDDFMTDEYLLLLKEDRKGKIEKPEHKKDRREKILHKLSIRYSQKLQHTIKNSRTKAISILTPIILLILSFIFISPHLGFELFPANDSGYISIDVQGPNGATKEYMNQYTNEIEKILTIQPEVKVYYLKIDNDTINLTIELTRDKIRSKNHQRTTQEFEQQIEQELSYLQSKGLKVSVIAQKDGPSSEQPIGIKLTTNTNNNLTILKKVSQDFEKFLSEHPGTKNINISSENSPGQFVYHFDNTKLKLMGLSPINFQYEAFFTTDGIKAGTIKGRYDDNDIEVYYKDNKDNITPQTLNETNVSTPIGKINLGDISNYEFTNAIDSISRENNKIIISIGADEKDGFKADQIQSELEIFAQSYHYPQDISYYMGGENEENADLIHTIMVSFFIALLFIFLILVLQFNSFSQPIMILYSVLVGLLGGNIGLLIIGQPYSVMFGIGFIALTGIIVNDSIVLLDRTNKNIAKGMNHTQAIKEAASARLHPIILTTLTTFLGLTSILGDMMWKSLAITIMVGIIFGSTATLFVMPSLYLKLNKK